MREYGIGESEDEPAHDYARDPRTDWLLGILDAVAPAGVEVTGPAQAAEQANNIRARSTPNRRGVGHRPFRPGRDTARNHR